MAINFPSNPTNSQEITEGNVTYVYNATKGYWESSEGSSSGASTTVYADMTALIAAAGMSNGDQAFVTGNNNLYIYSGSGWYKVATVQNDAPSAITGVNGTYQLAIDGTATTITAVSTDPEGFPLTWSYSASGLGSIATVSQVDNVFTITPSTTIADAGTFSLTINATDGVNGAVSTTTNLTLEFIVIVTNSKYTTLLATAVDTSDNNNITDSSSNNHSITVNGDAHAGTFSPYRSGGYSMYFDGSDYVDLGNGNLAINTEDFTIETWVNVTLGSNMSIANNSNWNSGNNTGWRALITTAGLINLTASQGSWNSYPSIYASTNAIPSNEWVHVVICRDSGVISSYINGIKDPNTVNYSASLNQTGGSSLSSYSLIGAYIADGGEYNNLTGYLSDFHFKLGSAKYTTTFSPPIERLTVESGTDVLLFNKPFLKDESTNAYTTSISGDPKIKPFSPYDYEEYSATNHGGSVYFDGSGDKLTIGGSSSDFNFGTNSFTIESWVYSTVAAVGPIFNTHRVGTGSGYYLSLLANGAINWGNYVDGTGDITTAAGAFTQNTWNHISLNRDASSSNSLKIYVNGILKYTGTSATDYNTFNYGPFVGGYDPGGNQYYFTGYTSDIVVVNGSVLRTGGTSVGDVAFTPPTTPISTPSNTKLHIKGTDASIIDKSQNRNLKITSNITSTTQTKFANTRSIYFDGSTSVNLNETLIFPTTNTPFTGELWFYPTNIAGAGRLIGQADVANSGRLSLNLETDGRIRLYWNGANNLYSTNSISDNQWHHIAFVRKNNGYLAVYVNGTETELAQDNNNRSIDSSLTRIGSQGPSYFPSYIQGYIQDVRLTNGLARYTTNFTPPTASLEG